MLCVHRMGIAADFFFFFPLVFFFPSVFFVISFWNSCEIDFGAPGFIFHISVVFLFFHLLLISRFFFFSDFLTFALQVIHLVFSRVYYIIRSLC